MADRQNTGAKRGPGATKQDTAGKGPGDQEDGETLGADGAPRDEWREAEGEEETEAQREDREAAREEHQERFAKGPVRGSI